MQYKTKKEYAALKGISRQAVEERLKRGTLTMVRVKVWDYRIPVDDAECADVKL